MPAVSFKHSAQARRFRSTLARMKSLCHFGFALIASSLISATAHAQMSSEGTRKTFVRCSANFGLVAYLSPDQKRKETYANWSLLFLLWAAESIPNTTKEQSNDVVTKELGLLMTALGDELRKVRDQPGLFTEFREKIVGESARCESLFEIEVSKRSPNERGAQGTP